MVIGCRFIVGIMVIFEKIFLICLDSICIIAMSILSIQHGASTVLFFSLVRMVFLLLMFPLNLNPIEYLGEIRGSPL